MEQEGLDVSGTGLVSTASIHNRFPSLVSMLSGSSKRRAHVLSSVFEGNISLGQSVRLQV